MQGSVHQGGLIQTTMTVKGNQRYEFPVSISGHPSDGIVTFILSIYSTTIAYDSTNTMRIWL